MAPALRRLAPGAVVAVAIAGFCNLSACTSADRATDEAPVAQAAPAPVPDLSGLAWVEGDQFLAVHDAKGHSGQPRVSLLDLPKTMGEGLRHRPVEIVWPATGPAGDLEAIAGIPGTSLYLLVESGSASRAGTPLQRIFLADYRDRQLRVTETVDWPVPVENVEGVAVARSGDQQVFLFAERAEGRGATALRWAPLALQPLGFGSFQEVVVTIPDPAGAHARPVSAIEIDSQGTIFIASAIDPGKDEGPFRSVIWRIGKIEAAPSGGAKVIVDNPPGMVATIDGLKVEAVAIRETAGREPEIFFGTDDENYGGIVRRVPGPAALAN
ncbi:MAG: hypothetical protein U1E66_07260 [Rhodospirillales bacterium]